MKGKLATLLGALVGLALAAALLVPSADREQLIGQASSRLLEGHQKLFSDGGASDGSDPEAPDEARRRSIYAVLDRMALGSPDPALTLTVRLDGELTDAPALRRAFVTRMNEANAQRPDQPPLRIAAGADPAPIRVELDVSSDGPEVALAASIAGPDGMVGIVPPPEGLQLADGEVAPTTTMIPDRTALVPPLLAILVALLFRRVLMALFAGILAGSVLLVHQSEPSWITSLLHGFRDVFTVFLRDELVKTFRIEIIGFVIALVAMVGVMSRSGGVRGMIQLIIGFARTVRSTLFVTWGMGLLIFFDDYANCLLVGNTMRPLTDRLRVSREKLSYIVDSTAAPIAGISLLSTWIAFEVSTYSAQLPAAGITENAYAIFLKTIPYRFYCLFTIVFVFLTILTGRDYGPMLHAERRARSTGKLVRDGGTPMVSDEATHIQPMEGLPLRWSHGLLPILLVLVATLTSIFVEGGGIAMLRSNPSALLSLSGVTTVLFDGSGGKPIFVGASCGLWLAAFLSGSNLLRVSLVGGLLAGVAMLYGQSWIAGEADTTSVLAAFAGVPYVPFVTAFLAGSLVAMLVARSAFTSLRTTARPHLPFEQVRRSSLASIKALFFAVVILFEAWMIGEVCQAMHTADYLVALLSGSVSAVMLPVLLFVAASLVAFATGSSWSTMSILLPNVVALAATVGVAEGIGALAMVVLCIGAVLEGSIFGDHCSPISDTTVLSSVSSASDHIDHVRTQAPYALTTGLLAIAIGYIPTVAVSWWGPAQAIVSAVLAITIILFVAGRRTPDGDPAEPDDLARDAPADTPLAAPPTADPMASGAGR